jgi:prevent-host-death family protein
MKKVSSTYARNNFQEIINKAHYVGESIVITRHNQPIAKLSPYHPQTQKSVITKPAIELKKKISKKQAEKMFKEMKEQNEKSLP